MIDDLPKSFLFAESRITDYGNGWYQVPNASEMARHNIGNMIEKATFDRRPYLVMRWRDERIDHFGMLPQKVIREIALVVLTDTRQVRNVGDVVFSEKINRDTYATEIYVPVDASGAPDSSWTEDPPPGKKVDIAVMKRRRIYLPVTNSTIELWECMRIE